MRFSDREILHVPRGNNFKTLKLIDKVAREEAKHPFIIESIERLGLDGSKDSIEKIFNAIYKITRFFPDPDARQYIRTVNRQLKDRRANCVDYTVFLSAFLRALKVPHKIRMVQTDEGRPGFNHIYCVLMDGTPLDLVIGQSQDGSEPAKLQGNRRPARFGEEVPFIRKHDRLIKA